jgi:hypothetical protein
MRTDGSAFCTVNVHKHPTTAHHPGRLAHVRREPGVIVDEGLVRRPSNQNGTLTMALHGQPPLWGSHAHGFSSSGAIREPMHIASLLLSGTTNCGIFGTRSAEFRRVAQPGVLHLAKPQ